jgi:hypothetical protein
MVRNLSKQPAVPKTSSSQNTATKSPPSWRAEHMTAASLSDELKKSPTFERWSNTLASSKTSQDAIDDILERVRNAYGSDPDAFFHALHRANVTSLAAMATARTPDALERALSKIDRSQRYGSWLNAASTIADQHHITDPVGHHELAQRLAEIRDRFVSTSALKPEGKSWSVPHGLVPWKVSRRKLSSFVHSLALVEQSLRDVAGDPAAMGAIKYMDPWRVLPRMVSSVAAMRSIVQSASKLEAQIGNRRLPKWTLEAANVCRDYWRTLARGEPRPFFPREGEPADLLSVGAPSFG